MQEKEERLQRLRNILETERYDGVTLDHWLRRPGIEWEHLIAWKPALAEFQAWPEVIEQAVLDIRYAGYIERQAAQVERLRKWESRIIPEHFDYQAVPQLRAEAREKLLRIRPRTLGQASRISGISPADIALLVFYLENARREIPATSGASDCLAETADA